MAAGKYEPRPPIRGRIPAAEVSGEEETADCQSFSTDCSQSAKAVQAKSAKRGIVVLGSAPVDAVDRYSVHC